MRPIFQLLNQEGIDAVIEDALEVLRTVGMFVENDDGIALAKDAGLEVDGARVFFDERTVRDALASAPSEIRLFDREGEPAAILGGDEVNFDPGSAAIHILDAETRRRRSPTTQDVVHFVWVTQACKNIAAQATGLTPGDVHGDIADRYRLYIALKNGTKPVVTGTFLKDAYDVMQRMLVAVRGGEDALREKPLAIFDCAPTPPLKWSDLTGQALIDSARAGIPAQLVSMPMAGATAPVTLRDVVVQHCAEDMGGVALHQLAAKGAPIVWGGSPSALDMRHGTTPMGAIETMMIDVSYAQVGKHLEIPTHAYMALSDAKNVDWQAGAETAAGAILAALAGINMISGPGMLDFESCQSLEKLVCDNEAAGMALRLARGVGERADPPAAELIAQVVEAGHFLGHPHTRKNFKKQLFIPGPIVDRGSYGEWEKRGAPSSFAAAREEVQRIVAKGNPAPLPPDLAAELDHMLRNEAERIGVEAPRAS